MFQLRSLCSLGLVLLAERKLVPPTNASGNVFGRVCLSVSVFVCLSRSALTLKALTYKIHLVCRYIFRISRLSSYVKVIGSRSRSQQQKVSSRNQ